MRILDLGPLEVETSGVTRPLPGRRLKALLAALLVRPGQTVMADYLIDAVWAEQVPTRAAAALDNLVWRLRRLLEPNRPTSTAATVLTHTEGHGYRLALAESDVDSWAFTGFAERLSRGTVPSAELPDATAGALRLWRGRPFGDAPGGDLIDSLRAQLAEHRLAVGLARIDALLDDNQPERAVTEVIPMIAEEPFAETLWARRIVGLRRAGRPAAADTVWQDCLALFDAELGTAPGRQVRDAAMADLEPPRTLPRPAGRPPAPFRVPTRRTSIVGRNSDIAAVADRCRRHPLTSLIGPMGCGKTRLAIAVADELRADFPDGVYFADLSDVVDGAVTADRVQQALDLPDEPATDPARVIRHFLADRAALLILDNCEQISDAVASLTEAILQDCPGLTVLATSRQPLGMDGESIFLVRPLNLPPGAGIDDLVGSPAAVLLAERLGAEADFETFSESERTAIVGICAATDGLPLSLEVAAALAPVLQLREIACHLAADPMGLRHTHRTATGPRSRRSLRESIAWSYDLLTADERRTHGRLSVLPPEFSLDAAVAVCADDHLAAAQVPAALAGLAYRSLLDPVGPERPGGPSRFHQLVPMRAHATEQLNAGGDAAPTTARLSRWTREFLLSGPRPGRPGQAEFYQHLSDNYRAVTAGAAAALAAGPSDNDVFAVARLLPYWVDRIVPADPLRISTALVHAVTESNGPLARAAAALVGGAVIAVNQRPGDARDDLVAAVAAIRRVGDDEVDPARWRQVADLLITVAACCWIGDDVPLAAGIVDTVAHYAELLDDADLRLWVAMFGCLTDVLDQPVAAAARATALAEQGQAIGNNLALLMGSVTCSVAAVVGGEAEVGLRWTAAALRHQRALGVRNIADTLETRGNHYMLARRPLEAVRCYAAARLQQDSLSRPWPHHPGTADHLAGARASLTSAQFAQAWASGERIGAAGLVEDWL